MVVSYRDMSQLPLSLIDGGLTAVKMVKLRDTELLEACQLL